MLHVSVALPLPSKVRVNGVVCRNVARATWRFGRAPGPSGPRCRRSTRRRSRRSADRGVVERPVHASSRRLAPPVDREADAPHAVGRGRQGGIVDAAGLEPVPADLAALDGGGRSSRRPSWRRSSPRRARPGLERVRHVLVRRVAAAAERDPARLAPAQEGGRPCRWSGTGRSRRARSASSRLVGLEARLRRELAVERRVRVGEDHLADVLARSSRQKSTVVLPSQFSDVQLPSAGARARARAGRGRGRRVVELDLAQAVVVHQHLAVLAREHAQRLHRQRVVAGGRHRPDLGTDVAAVLGVDPRAGCRRSSCRRATSPARSPCRTGGRGSSPRARAPLRSPARGRRSPSGSGCSSP